MQSWLSFPSVVATYIILSLLHSLPTFFKTPNLQFHQSSVPIRPTLPSTTSLIHKFQTTMTSITIPPDTTTADLSVGNTGNIRFLNHNINFADVPKTNFSALNQIEELDLHISADSTIAICAVQDSLFSALAHLNNTHKLHTLNVSIYVDNGSDRHYVLFTSNYAERMYRTDVMREFRDIEPGDLSRAHLTAFLTDPLRTIRNLRKNGKKQPKFTLDFTGKGGRPWRDIKGQVYELIKSGSAVPDHRIFSRYFEPLRAFLDFVTKHKLADPRTHKIMQNAADARIQGDVQTFIEHHETLMKNFAAVVSKTLEGRVAKVAISYQLAEQREYQLREYEYLLHDLCKNVPAADADASFFGYNLADAGLRHWQDTGKAEEKVAKEKRKQEREKRKRESEQDESRKKAKTKS